MSIGSGITTSCSDHEFARKSFFARGSMRSHIATDFYLKHVARRSKGPPRELKAFSAPYSVRG